MGYYEEKKKELQELLFLVRKEKSYLKTAASLEEKNIGEKRLDIEKRKDQYKKMQEGVIQLAKERQQGFPWLAKAYDEYFQLQEETVVDYLKNKKHPAGTAAQVVREQSQLRRQAEKEKKIAQYLLEYYESIAPFLVDLKEEVDIITDRERELLKEYL